MSAPSDARAQKAREWAAYGDDDLRAAEHLLGLSDACPHHLVAYHAQQCAEKYLKGFPVLCGTDFPYTHNIARLLELCPPRLNWLVRLKVAMELSPFAMTARYPNHGAEVSRGMAEQAISTARRVRDVVRESLADEGLFL